MASEALRSQVAAKWQEAFSRLNRNESGIAGLVSFSQAWNYALRVLRPRPLEEPRENVDMNQVKSAFTIINSSRRLPFLLETFLEELKQQYWLIQKDVEEHMARFLETEDAGIVRGLILRLVAWFKHWAPLQELGTTIYAAYSLSFQTHLFSSVPPTFARAIKALVASTLSAITTDTPPGAEDPNASIWQAFETLGLIDRYESIIATVGYEFIEHHVLETCTGEWSRPMLGELRDWMSDKVVPWMLLIYARGATNAEEARGMLQGVGSRFDFHINKTLCDLRTREIFDIIIDFPDSTGALHDLRDCLQRVDQRPALIKALRQANRKRLLHPGADTKLILSQYVAIIKCLRIIDPPGVLLFKVADPIRRYLRDRPDTIRCIVANLVGDDTDSPDSLLDDTIDPTITTGAGAGGGPTQSSSNTQLLTNPANQVDDYADPNWDPEPIDAGPEFRTNKPSDVLSTLVSIYDSQDLFVKELQVLLAQRLLAIPSSSSASSSASSATTVERIDKERRNVEILKLRFGEAALGVCEVMLRDMSDSRRVDGLVQAVEESILHPTIISHHFWPPLAPSGSSGSSGSSSSAPATSAGGATGTIQMPGPLSTLQQTYSETFTKLKPDKKLRFLPHLGTLTLTLSFPPTPPTNPEGKGKEMEVIVPPLEAAFIQLFSEKGVWTLDELIDGVGGSACVDRGPALKALLTWIDYGVVEEIGEGVFRLIEGERGEKLEGVEGGGGGGMARQAVAAQEAVVQPVSGAQQQQAEQMRVYWKFIEGMLTNLGGLPLDRIQSMLRFAPGYDQSVEQLAVFLEAARREGVVVCREGVWRLNK